MPSFVKSALATTVNHRTSTAAHIAQAIASVNTNESLIHMKLLQSYPEVVNYNLKKFAIDQAKSEIDAKILRYTQPAHEPSM